MASDVSIQMQKRGGMITVNMKFYPKTTNSPIDIKKTRG